MTTPARPIRIFAPAKINLALSVVGLRNDGYHDLDSLVAFAGVGDTLSVRPAPVLSLSVGGPKAGALARQPDNIVLKAARLLAERTGCDQGAAIHLKKRLPVAAGIGGGSADAAATLKALCRLWQLDPEAIGLDAIALELGADVPVCLAGHPARMQGVGDLVQPLSVGLPPAWLLLVNPGRALATPAVFKARQGPFSAPRTLLDRTPSDTADLAALLAQGGNDLTEAAIGLMPVIERVLDDLAALRGCLLARMSGSGATCFGLFADQDSAHRAALAMQEIHHRWWIAPAPLLAPQPDAS
ncbi:MAG: 4-(cytidine 5'-diphospho)-2-C-methyl-D-erythritol kinase [Rhodospirillaceae bacterium]|nr:4-(cytidine 5'-diphospho)-2-C-methyl-D-erythritol kinase [Rhodospirillaceae bacterium]